MIGTKREVVVANRGKALTFAFVSAIAASLMLLVAVGYTALPARAATTFTVDRKDDDTSASATACTSVDNDCTLRGAIQKANDEGANLGKDTITFASCSPRCLGRRRRVASPPAARRYAPSTTPKRPRAGRFRRA